jgi:CRP/FNR family transcriptional regulator
MSSLHRGEGNRRKDAAKPGNINAQLSERFPSLQAITGRSQEQLLASAVGKHLEAKQVLAREGRECAYLPLVLQGSLRVYKTSESGKELTLYRIVEGESCVLTATCILNQRSFPAVAEAEREVELLLVPARLVVRLVDEDGAWRRFVFGLYARRLEIMLTLVEEVAFRRVDSRLASYLIDRGRETGAYVEKTHVQIASDLGTSREVVTRILGDFELHGLIVTRRGRIEVIQPGELQKRV